MHFVFVERPDELLVTGQLGGAGLTWPGVELVHYHRATHNHTNNEPRDRPPPDQAVSVATPTLTRSRRNVSGSSFFVPIPCDPLGV